MAEAPGAPGTTTTSVVETTELKAEPVSLPEHLTVSFYVTIAVTLAGLFLIIYGCVKNNNTAITVGGGLVGLQVGAFNIAKGVTKGLQS